MGSGREGQVRIAETASIGVRRARARDRHRWSVRRTLLAQTLEARPDEPRPAAGGPAEFNAAGMNGRTPSWIVGRRTPAHVAGLDAPRPRGRGPGTAE